MMKSKSGKVTLKTLAQHLDLSVTTVARAINHSPLTSKATIKKVNEAAEKLGYVPNLEGAKLRTGKTFVVAVLLKLPKDQEVGDPTLLGVLQGLHTRLSGTDYTVRAILSSSHEEEMEQLKRLVAGSTADGVILDHTSPQDERVRLLLEADIPFVTFGRTELFTPHAYFDIDNEDAAWQGTTALIEKGYRRIAFLDSQLTYTFTLQRLNGYRRALQENALAFEDTLVKHFEPNALEARKIARDLLTEQQIDAMVCGNDVILLGARAGIRDAAPMKDDEIGFAVRGGTHLSHFLSNTPIISYYSRVETGKSLGDLLLQRMTGASPDALQVLVKTELR